MEKQPLVSIIVPVYNGENYIQEAIYSLINQTYQPIEIIVVNDGSTDGTVEKLASFQKELVLINKKNEGVATALNLGINHAKGKYIAWLSHDDLFLPNKLKKQVAFLDAQPEYCACYTDFEIVDPHTRHIKYIYTPYHQCQDLPSQFLKNMYINGSTILLRKECLKIIGLFSPSLLHTQDMDMWLRIAKVGEIGKIDEVLVKSRSHPLQGSLKFERQITEEQRYFENLINQNPIEYFFPIINLPETKKISEVTALKHKKIAKVFFVHRKWFHFALNQYQISQQYQPSLDNIFNLFLCKFIIFLFGDEIKNLIYKKRAKMFLGFGMNSQALKLSSKFFLKYPLRIDVLLILIKSLIPAKLYKLIRSMIKGR